jgi:hypothetical protein
MSTTVSRGRTAGQQMAGQPSAGQQAAGNPAAGNPAAAIAERANRRRRGGWAAAGLVALAAAGVVSAWWAGVLSPAGSPGAAGQGAPAPATQAVTRQDIAATTPVNATLGFAGSYAVTGQGGGKLTWLPPAGRVIRQGQALYKTDNNSPVVLLHGRVPAWRPLHEGVTGQDVTQLNHDLVALGDADRADIAALGWNYFSWQTKAGVAKLQSALGIPSPSGALPLGRVVFEPSALRVSQVTGGLGGPASGPVLAATTDRHVVTIPLDAAQQSQVTAGDRVTVTLPDGTSTPGVVSSVGAVAARSGSGQNATTTIPVTVRLTHPEAAGILDQAPVTVNITTASVHDALVVPVGALLARSSGGYAVEVAGPRDTRRLVPVTPGIFDDTVGLVQVTGALAPGQRVVVPAT